VRRFLKEPLLHFAVLGIGLFLLYRAISGGAGAAPNEIVVDSPRVDVLATQFARTRQRVPTEQELQGLVENYVRDEVLYREGLALGLDRDDPVVRNRMRLRVELIADTAVPEVSEQAVQEWFDEHRDRYAAPTLFDFRHAFFAPASHRESLDADIAEALHALGASADIDATAVGDPSLLPAALHGATAADVAAQFGDEFAAALVAAPSGRWIGPVRSAYGLHLVRVDAREEGEPVTLAAARDEVERDVRDARAQAASDALYARLRARYSVRIEKPTHGLEDAAALAAQTP
jgi:parvulin-like peptidyl-prolyl cis-trans isomerase-like protein